MSWQANSQGFQGQYPNYVDPNQQGFSSTFQNQFGQTRDNSQQFNPGSLAQTLSDPSLADTLNKIFRQTPQNQSPSVPFSPLSVGGQNANFAPMQPNRFQNTPSQFGTGGYNEPQGNLTSQPTNAIQAAIQQVQAQQAQVQAQQVQQAAQAQAQQAQAQAQAQALANAALMSARNTGPIGFGARGPSRFGPGQNEPISTPPGHRPPFQNEPPGFAGGRFGNATGPDRSFQQQRGSDRGGFNRDLRSGLNRSDHFSRTEHSGPARATDYRADFGHRGGGRLDSARNAGFGRPNAPDHRGGRFPDRRADDRRESYSRDGQWETRDKAGRREAERPRSPRTNSLKLTDSKLALQEKAPEKTDRKPTEQKETNYYLFFGSPFNVMTHCRDLAETRKRYLRLYTLPEFSLSRSMWQLSFPPFFSSHYGQGFSLSPFPQGARFPVTIPLLDDVTPIECENEFRPVEDSEETPPPDLVDGIEYSIKLLLCCGVPLSADKSLHLTKQLQFLVIKKEKSELALVGGTYDQKVDGGDWRPPVRNTHGVECDEQDQQEDRDAGFIRCAVRHAKDKISLDLTAATHWWRFLEIHYTKDVDHRHICIIYAVSLADLVPQYSSFLQIWKERETIKIERQQQKERLARIAVEKAEQERIKRNALRKEKEEGEVPKPIQITLNAAEPDTKLSTTSPSEPTAPPTRLLDVELTDDVEAPGTPTSGAPPSPGTPQSPLYDQEAQAQQPQTQLSDAQAQAQETQQPSEKTNQPDNPEPTEAQEQILVDMAKAPKQACLYASIKRIKYQQLKAVLISLHGLLDYTLEDDKPDTFEVSLAAENFNDLLQRDFGMVIFDTMIAYMKRVSLSTVEESNDNEPLLSDEKDKIHPKEDTAHKGEATPEDEEGSLVQDDHHTSPGTDSAELPPEEMGQLGKRKREELSPSTDEKKARFELTSYSPLGISRGALEAAFLFFDNNAVGYFKESDLELIFASVGQGLSKKQLRSMIAQLWPKDQRKLNYQIFLNQI